MSSVTLENTAELQRARAAISERCRQPGAMLPVLHGIQDALGHIPDALVPEVAAALNVSRAEVHGVITFYHHFRRAAPARHTVQVCRAEACQARGGEALAAHAERVLGCGFHERSADGVFSLEPVYCLGHCASGPAVIIDDAMHAAVTPARFDRLIEAAVTAPARDER